MQLLEQPPWKPPAANASNPGRPSPVAFPEIGSTPLSHLLEFRLFRSTTRYPRYRGGDSALSRYRRTDIAFSRYRNPPAPRHLIGFPFRSPSSIAIEARRARFLLFRVARRSDTCRSRRGLVRSASVCQSGAFRPPLSAALHPRANCWPAAAVAATKGKAVISEERGFRGGWGVVIHVAFNFSPALRTSLLREICLRAPFYTARGNISVSCKKQWWGPRGRQGRSRGVPEGTKDCILRGVYYYY